MKDLFLGQGVAHTIMLLAFVIGIGTYLGRFKIKGVSIGATWILFMGILMSHLGFRADPEMLHFIKECSISSRSSASSCSSSPSACKWAPASSIPSSPGA